MIAPDANSRSQSVIQPSVESVHGGSTEKECCRAGFGRKFPSLLTSNLDCDLSDESTCVKERHIARQQAVVRIWDNFSASSLACIHPKQDTIDGMLRERDVLFIL